MKNVFVMAMLFFALLATITYSIFFGIAYYFVGQAKLDYPIEKVSSLEPSGFYEYAATLERISFIKRTLPPSEYRNYCQTICSKSKTDIDVFDFSRLVKEGSESFHDPIYLYQLMYLNFISQFFSQEMLDEIPVIRKSENSLSQNIRDSFKVHQLLIEFKDHFPRIFEMEDRMKSQSKVFDEYKLIYQRCQSKDLEREKALKACVHHLSKFN